MHAERGYCSSVSMTMSRVRQVVPFLVSNCSTCPMCLICPVKSIILCVKSYTIAFDFEIGCKGSGILRGVQVQMHPKSNEVGCVCANSAEKMLFKLCGTAQDVAIQGAFLRLAIEK